MNKEIIAKMDSYISEYEEEILGVILDLAKIPSVKGESADGAPNGVICRQCLDAAIEKMREYGFCASVKCDGMYGLATSGDGEKCIGLFAHTDVVPVSEEDWLYTKPFEPKRIGDVLVGRGVSDNKSGVAISIFSLELLKAAGLSPKSKISVFLGSCEETSMADIEAFAASEKMPDVCLVPDGEFPVSFGEKGICHVMGRMGDAFEDVISLSGGSAYNIVMGKAECIVKYSDKLFSELGERVKKNAEIDICKKDDTIVITAHGKPKHAAMPEGAVNALAIMSGELCKLSSLSENDREIFKKICALTSSFYGEELGISCSDDCFGALTSVCGICGMTKEGYPTLSLDVRYGTGITGEQVEKKISEYFVEILQLDNKPGFAIPRDNPVAMALEKVYTDFSKNPDDRGFYLGGGTYARHLKNAFSVGTEAEYIENDCVELPAGHGGAHQSDEVLRINRFFEALKIVAMMIYECDRIMQNAE